MGTIIKRPSVRFGLQFQKLIGVAETVTARNSKPSPPGAVTRLNADCFLNYMRTADSRQSFVWCWARLAQLISGLCKSPYAGKRIRLNSRSWHKRHEDLAYTVLV